MSDDLKLAQINTVPLRFSRLKLMGKSPAHYAAGVEPHSSSIDIGNAADLLILGGTQKVVAYPGAVRRGKEWESWKADHQDDHVVTKKELDVAMGMAAAVMRHEEAQRVLTGAVQETLLWNHNGRACRGTPDVRSSTFLTDLKTGETSDPRRFQWKLRDFAYHAQLAWYRDGMQRLGMAAPRDVYIVAVEQSPPHVVTVFRLNDHVLEMGDRLWRTWFEHLRMCEESGRFPGYSDSTVDLDLPDPDEEYFEMADAGMATEEAE